MTIDSLKEFDIEDEDLTAVNLYRGDADVILSVLCKLMRYYYLTNGCGQTEHSLI